VRRRKSNKKEQVDVARVANYASETHQTPPKYLQGKARACLIKTILVKKISLRKTKEFCQVLLKIYTIVSAVYHLQSKLFLSTVPPTK
jgi:hypothetical protein